MQGAFVAIGAAAIVMAVLCAALLDWRRPQGVARPGDRAAFTIVARAPGAVPLLLTSTLRFCVWYAWLTYLAASFTERFGASTGLIAWVWFLGAGAYFVGNMAAGRIANPAGGEQVVGWRSATRLLMASSVATVALAPLVFIAPTVPLALAATAAFCLATGVATATVVSLLIRRYSAQRGAVMGLNTVGLNVGTFPVPHSPALPWASAGTSGWR